MDLATYLREAGMTASALADAVGVRVSTITRLRDGSRAASLDLALRIERATNGKVTPKELPTHAPRAETRVGEAA